MQNPRRTLDGFYVLFILKAVHRQRYHAVEGFHAEVVVVVLFEYCGRIDQV